MLKFIRRIPWYIRIAFCVILVGLIFLIIVIYTTTQPVIESGVTDRGRAYIQEQKTQNPQLWQDVNLENKKTTNADSEIKQITTDCFAVNINLQVKTIRDQGQCNRLLILADGLGEMALSVRQAPGMGLDDLPDVIMRRSKPSIYIQNRELHGSSMYLTFKKESEVPQEKTAFYQISPDRIFVMGLISNSNRNIDQILGEILDHLIFK